MSASCFAQMTSNLPSEGLTIQYPVFLFKGSLPPHASPVVVVNGNILKSLHVFEGQFKALIPLTPGDNIIELKASEQKTLQRKIVYKPDKNLNRVRLIYLKSSDDSSSNRYKYELSESAAKKRISISAWLMQTFTAEKMFEATGERLTFNMNLDPSGMPIVESHSLSLTTSQLRKMSGDSLWSTIYGALEVLPERAQTLDLVFMSFSDYDPTEKKTYAHAALGGGRLGIFSTLGLHTWPSSLETVPLAFSDTAGIDSSKHFDDSNHRGTYWANASTGIGASLHELGHCLNLPHTETGVMSRGFDFFNRTFVSSEPGHGHIKPQDETHWHPDSVSILKNNPWISHGRDSQACLYEHDNFLGESVCLNSNSFNQNFFERNFNDRVSSVIVSPGVNIEGFEHINHSGLKIDLSGKIKSLNHMGLEWNDSLSSIRFKK